MPQLERSQSDVTRYFSLSNLKEFYLRFFNFERPHLSQSDPELGNATSRASPLLPAVDNFNIWDFYQISGSQRAGCQYIQMYRMDDNSKLPLLEQSVVA